MGTIRLRYTSRLEPYESYAFLLAWPVLFLVTGGGYWRWVVAFMPDLCVRILRQWRRRRPAVLVAARRTGRGVELVDTSGTVIDSLDDADIEFVSRVLDSSGQLECVRVARARGKELSLAATSTDEVRNIVSELAIDLDTVRSRYRTGSLAVRLTLLLVIGFGMLAWTWAAPTSDRQLAQLFGLYTNWITLPLVVLFAIPTWVEIGADGIAWRWLFIHRYVAFASTQSFEAIQGGFRLTTTEGARHSFAIDKGAISFGQHFNDALSKARERVAPEVLPVDGSMFRLPAETLEAWVTRLRASASIGTAYRARSTTHLWEIAEDPAAPFEARCAALMILTTTPAARERARAIATRIVAPRPRAAADAIAAGTENDELVELLRAALPVQSGTS